jgi:hypothetical protein
VVVYRAKAATCNACPVKVKCTESAHGRIVHRSFFADYVEKVRGYHTTPAYQKAMRKRQVWVEPLFAEAKAWHGLRRFRLRGLANVNSEGLLIAAGQKRSASWPRSAGGDGMHRVGASWLSQVSDQASLPSPGDNRSDRRPRHR